MKEKIKNLEELNHIIADLKSTGKKIVHCHGVFDLLHIGHIKHFKSAKKFGDVLIVSVTPDKFVSKGFKRPHFNSQQRIEGLASIEVIDFVILNNASNASDIIKKIKPDFYCKGRDYKNFKDDITGQIKKELIAVKKNGGKVFYTEDELFSSSKIINSSGFNLSKEQKRFLDKMKLNKNLNSNLKISNTINSLSDLKVLVIGETIIDEYQFCEALGKSGKEPVLTMKPINTERYLGGSLAICNHLSSFCNTLPDPLN